MTSFKRIGNDLRVILSVFQFLFICVYAVNTHAQELQDQLSTLYKDPKGYFMIRPPANWRIQEYSQDSRGKVAFIGPPNTDLRVLAKGSDFDSFDDLLNTIKDIEERIGINTDIQKITFLGRPAVKRNFTARGLKLLAIDFIEGKVTHNLQYTAPEYKYDKYLAVALKSMNTYETILRDVSSQDVKNHTVAQKLRLGQLFLEQGNKDLALVYVKEGLEIDPENPKLLRLKKLIDSERQ